jgi:CHAT domain-containing protein
MLSVVAEVLQAKDRADVEVLLADGSLAGSYFSTHGDNAGLHQSIELADGGRISAASALTLRWPNWIVFASCIVGELTIQAGMEATGLVTSCLLGGASSVVAGVIEVEARTADALCTSAVARLMNDRHPAVALREAQLAFLGRRRLASPHRWAGYVCISRAFDRVA